MTANKTVANKASVQEFLEGVTNERRKSDALVILDMMQRITGEPAVMWGKSLIGFGSYHYKYDSGREGDSALVSFSPRKANLVVYIMPGFDKYEDLMSRLGKHKTGKSCLYLNKLADVDMAVLEELIKKSVVHMKEKYNVA